MLFAHGFSNCMYCKLDLCTADLENYVSNVRVISTKFPCCRFMWFPCQPQLAITQLPRSSGTMTSGLCTPVCTLCMCVCVAPWCVHLFWNYWDTKTVINGFDPVSLGQYCINCILLLRAWWLLLISLSLTLLYMFLSLAHPCCLCIILYACLLLLRNLFLDVGHCSASNFKFYFLLIMPVCTIKHILCEKTC